MTLLARLRERGIRRSLADYKAVYAADHVDVGAEQLARLNAGWAESLVRSPWARAQKARLELPDQFEDWSTFERLVPVQRKADLRAVLATSVGGAAEVEWRSTGGTTAQPMRLPVFASEAEVAALDIWLGRGRLGISASDRLFLIWGHSHIFGVGLKGVVGRLRRRASDWALGYTRWNAYRLAPDDLDRAADALLQSGASYVIGYASALDRFARANQGRSASLHRLGLAAVIATAEGFPRADSREVLEACFGCPVIMEYGAVETGPVAYQRPSGGYDVFWAHHRLEALDAEGPGAGREMAVTSLYPRALPLLRYAIGDLIQPAAGEDRSLTEFLSVVGRSNEAVTLPDGAVIHSEAFTHAVRDIQGVRAYQIVRRQSGTLPAIRYESAAPLTPTEERNLRQRMGKVHPLLFNADTEWVSAIPPSVAGKHRMVVDEN